MEPLVQRVSQAHSPALQLHVWHRTEAERRAGACLVAAGAELGVGEALPAAQAAPARDSRGGHLLGLQQLLAVAARLWRLRGECCLQQTKTCDVEQCSGLPGSTKPRNSRACCLHQLKHTCKLDRPERSGCEALPSTGACDTRITA